MDSLLLGADVHHFGFSAMTPLASPLVCNAYNTRDADEHAACLTGWGQCYEQLSAGAFQGEFEEFCFDKVQLFRERINQSMHESGMPWLGSRTFGVATSMEGEGWFCGEPFKRDSIIALPGGEIMDFRTPRQHEILAIVVDAKAFDEYTQTVEQRDLAAALNAGALLSATPQHTEQLRAFLATLFESLKRAPKMLEHPQIRKALTQAAFASIVDILDAAPKTKPSPADRAHQTVVDRARAFLNARTDAPVSVADLCAHLGVSRRTLQYGFQEVLGIRPMQFLRVIRLNHVRRALKKADPNAETIGDIAARWGFWHLSRFATDYREMFGELPSDTLRR
ncbi:AraC family transcriptional regulator [Betaproteobacteria bacterium]|nr:AraC family transcriptional regulator [Betaproteobacteria bacterium]GHU41798.1 AraC family transcriptional regulator [Betaproteobacteria bacterium]